MENQDLIIKAVKKVTGIFNVTLESKLTDNLNIDSMGFIALVVELEETLNLKFGDEDILLDLFKDVQSLVDYFDKQ